MLRISVDVVAGLALATPNFGAQRQNILGGWDKPGHDKQTSGST
jgi:hypothetical protein